jgi:putative transposase
MAETKRMTSEQVVGYLIESEGLDVLRESLAWVVQQLMEAEVSELIGAERGERSHERLTHRNGYRPRPWMTRAGELELAIPKIRRGSHFPSFLEPRKRSEQALVSVVQEAYVAGVSTRKVDQVVESLALRISKSEVSRICQGLDEQVDAFRNRPLEAATRSCGWTPRAHAGLKKAIGQLLGCPWQRCSVHFLREALGHVRKHQQGMVAALLRPLFNADGSEQARQLVGDALERLRKPLPKVATLLEEAEEDLLAFYGFPAEHWPKLRSTNPLERVNREIGRRTDVVGIFPNDRSLIRLAASVVIEQNDEWLVGRRYLSNHSLEAVLDQEQKEDKEREETRELTAA